MKTILFLTTVSVFLSFTSCKETKLSETGRAANGEYYTVGTKTEKDRLMNLHDFKVTDINGKEFNMASLKGKKVLIVNVASECGYTPQYEQLEAIYKKYGGEKFEIIGFPANNFGGQEPGADSTIASFCQKNYGVTFKMMSKISVVGDDQHPVYKWLTNSSQNGVSDAEVKWNFHKFLIDENGKWVKSVGTRVKPDDAEIVNWIEGK
jgi:glutathione peroxidase